MNTNQNFMLSAKNIILFLGLLIIVGFICELLWSVKRHIIQSPLLFISIKRGFLGLFSNRRRALLALLFHRIFLHWISSNLKLLWCCNGFGCTRNHKIVKSIIQRIHFEHMVRSLNFLKIFFCQQASLLCLLRFLLLRHLYLFIWQHMLLKLLKITTSHQQVKNLWVNLVNSSFQ